MHIKNIFILNARAEDRLVIDSRLVKARGAKIPEHQACWDSLRVTFIENAERLNAMGFEERIDLLYVDLDRLRQSDEAISYNILGRSKPVRLELS
jgi:hypothetical protein